MTNTRRRGVVRSALLTLLLVPLLTLAPASPAGAAEPDRLDARGGALDAGAPVLRHGVSYVGAAAHPGGGYWLATNSGGVFAQGGAPFYGSAGELRISSPVVAIAARPRGGGYWLATAAGGVFTFGDAAFHGSIAGQVGQPVVAVVSTPSGNGYWLVTAAGGVFTFGDARFGGSLAGTGLRSPVTAAAGSRNGGYWLATADGGVYSFAGAPFHGSAGGALLPATVVGMAVPPTGDGYWLAAADGSVYSYGGARFGGVGATSDEALAAIAAVAGGYVLLRTPAGPPAPPGTGSGRRIVYSNPLQRVWLVDGNNRVVRTYLVSGRKGSPAAGSYAVFSRSAVASAGHDGITMRKMVRFARGERLAIGFHDIPQDANGRPLQREDDLGGYRSAGCVRQSSADAAVLWEFAQVGTPVVVVY